MRKIFAFCGLLFAFVFAFSYGFNSTLIAGDGGPHPCTVPDQVGDCCEVQPDGSGIHGVCVFVNEWEVQCRCDCIFQQWTTCEGPNNCHLDDCTGEPE